MSKGSSSSNLPISAHLSNAITFMARSDVKEKVEGDWVADHLAELREQAFSLIKMEGYKLSQASVGAIMRNLCDAIVIADYYRSRK